MHPKRVATMPSAIWTTEQFANLIERIAEDETEGAPRTKDKAIELRRMIVRDITLCAVPAGNA